MMRPGYGVAADACGGVTIGSVDVIGSRAPADGHCAHQTYAVLTQTVETPQNTVTHKDDN
ncbi:hypothetical protein [Cutibacterium sp. V970]|uniref:hypothetical protein n=1 Tax=Cutibacterium sp. V970 TaxID=3446481 RepID=UPI003EE36A4A